MIECEVCVGTGLYPIFDNHGRERYNINCPECFGSGEADEEAIAEERAAAEAERAANIQRGKYERAMAEKHELERAQLFSARAQQPELPTETNVNEQGTEGDSGTNKAG